MKAVSSWTPTTSAAPSKDVAVFSSQALNSGASVLRALATLFFVIMCSCDEMQVGTQQYPLPGLPIEQALVLIHAYAGIAYR